MARRAREAANGRPIVLIGENEPQEVKLIEKYGLDALWNDDWHHAAMVAATGSREAYYTDYRGTAQEFVSMAQSGFLYQGQYYAWQKKLRGTSSAHLAPERLVCFLQNHDQLANSARGERLHFVTKAGLYRALTALLLLGPNTPLLFQGQEFGSSAPFLYFADHEPELAVKVSKGRREFLEQFPSIKKLRGDLPAPDDVATFERCKLDHRERTSNAEVVTMHRELLRLRRQLRGRVRCAVIGAEAFVLRYDTHLLIVNLGDEVLLGAIDEPLLAGEWEVAWSSDGTSSIDMKPPWRVPAECAILLAAAS
jgi:maltooligosyltrehalose trehalohydrolase